MHLCLGGANISVPGKCFVLAILVAFGTRIVWSQSLLDQVDGYVKQRMQDLHIPGLSLVVLKDDRIVKASGFGMASVESDSPATPETVYKIASLSKAFIASAILLLLQEGKIGLDDRVSKYLDGAPETWNKITIRHLLTHTSGIVRDPADYHPYEERPITAVIKDSYSLPLAFQPGDGWLYSNIGYYVLAQVITKASGKPWNEFIAERLFAPAQMTSTRLATVADIVPHRANGYHHTEAGMQKAEDWIAIRPSGAFLSSVLDLARWDAFFDSNTLIMQSSRKLMLTPTNLNNHTPVDYGFGWYVDRLFGHRRIHHDGQFPGFRTDYERFVDDKLTVIILANADNQSVESLAIKVAGFYEPSLTLPPFTLTADVPHQPVAKGTPVTVRINAKDDGHAAPDTLVEMEIWDAAGKSVFKDHKQNEDFGAGQSNTYSFSWTPVEIGTYTINIGAYGPKWMPSYAWKENAATINVTQ
jgi:CubicO group peptidase (beta-lactamase class C family)